MWVHVDARRRLVVQESAQAGRGHRPDLGVRVRGGTTEWATHPPTHSVPKPGRRQEAIGTCVTGQAVPCIPAADSRIGNGGGSVSC